MTCQHTHGAKELKVHTVTRFLIKLASARTVIKLRLLAAQSSGRTCRKQSRSSLKSSCYIASLTYKIALNNSNTGKRVNQ